MPRRLAATVALAVAVGLAGCSEETNPATNITATSATLNGTLTWKDGEGPGEFWWEYSNDDGVNWTATAHTPFATLACSDPSGTCSAPVSKGITGLTPSSHYIFRLGGWTTLNGQRTGTVYGDSNWTSGSDRDPPYEYDSFDSPAVLLTAVSTDPYTNTSSQHRTEVEPDTFSYGSTIVGAFQVGRFYDGGASNIGWATSTDGGTTWSHGFLPGITVYQGGTYARVSDPSVAYDARHATWIISSLALTNTPSVAGVAVVVSRSTNGGLSWSAPVVVASAPGGSLDKNWTVCDNTATSPYYGRCYTQWDDNADGNRIRMSTSADGGQTWGAGQKTADNATGLGGQPVVRPNGTVVVPIDNANETAIRSFNSTDGGASWGSTVNVASISRHTVAGGLRAPPLPSAEIDGAGNVYVVWQDCRFRTSCAANDIVLTTSSDGITWSSLRRIPIDSTSSGVDHFIPGLAVDKSSSGGSARLGLIYHYYPSAACGASTCQLDVGFISSNNGGATWSAPIRVAGPQSLSWLPSTSQGRMFGDYISTSFSGGKSFPLVPVAKAPANGLFDQAIYAPTNGLTLASPASAATPSGAGAPSASTPAAAPGHPATAH